MHESQNKRSVALILIRVRLFTFIKNNCNDNYSISMINHSEDSQTKPGIINTKRNLNYSKLYWDGKAWRRKQEMTWRSVWSFTQKQKKNSQIKAWGEQQTITQQSLGKWCSFFFFYICQLLSVKQLPKPDHQSHLVHLNPTPFYSTYIQNLIQLNAKHTHSTFGLEYSPNLDCIHS